MDEAEPPNDKQTDIGNGVLAKEGATAVALMLAAL